ncbi:hypothetical protein KN815_01600 [Streptomyces sp. 4503]|uniref:Uncharacterized protein n=1 Tax=Streptomyces niphimycinicus TaxID=2842201 RepID=A0ABS6C7N7_9ACTN|nr:hypothetical protein [Streptomyces niphimycinicus]MBU3862845.1 hypothetical protein [Streptomyces niphimycinicus]
MRTRACEGTAAIAAVTRASASTARPAAPGRQARLHRQRSRRPRRTAPPPYLTEHINRFGEYPAHELGIQPEAYDPKVDVDFTQLRDQDLTTARLGQAA